MVSSVAESTLTLSSAVAPASDANVSIEEASAPEEIAVVTSLLTLPRMSSSCWVGGAIIITMLWLVSDMRTPRSVM